MGVLLAPNAHVFRHYVQALKNFLRFARIAAPLMAHIGLLSLLVAEDYLATQRVHHVEGLLLLLIVEGHGRHLPHLLLVWLLLLVVVHQVNRQVDQESTTFLVGNGQNMANLRKKLSFGSFGQNLAKTTQLPQHSFFSRL